MSSLCNFASRRIPFYSARNHMCSQARPDFDVICSDDSTKRIVENSLNDWSPRVPFGVQCSFSTLGDDGLPHGESFGSGSQFDLSKFYQNINSIEATPVLFLAETTPSTQTLLESCPFTMSLPVVCIADSQTQARGKLISCSHMCISQLNFTEPGLYYFIVQVVNPTAGPLPLAALPLASVSFLL